MRKYLHTVDNEWFKQRVTGVIYVVSAVFVVLILRLFYLQVIEGEEYRRLSANNSIRLQSVDAPRGLIYDRQGKTLVENRPSFDLHITLKDAKPVEQTLQNLAHHIGIPAGDLLTEIEQAPRKVSYKPIPLRMDIGRNALAAVAVNKFDLPGITLKINPRRHYLFGHSAAHLLGYMGEINTQELESGVYEGCRVGDYIGKFGIEKSLENVLRGKRGGRQVEVNATGQMVRILKTVDAQPGHNVYLSIDHQLQTKAESLLVGKAGAVVAIEPNSGEILALASSPSFDQNAFVNGLSRTLWQELTSNPQRPMENKVIQAQYPPASTYKILVALAALEEKAIDASTTFYCPGFHRYGNRVYRCWRKGGHGDVNVLQALERSCDVFFYNVGDALGVDVIAKYAKACGFGAPTGIELDNESRGLVPTSAWKERRFGEPWQGGETLSIAIGQGFNLVTPMQLAMFTAAVGNGGTLYKPRLVREIQTAAGESVKTETQEVLGQIPVGPEALALVQAGLWDVVNGQRGTARVAKLKDIEISGKTGTAQVISRREEEIEEAGETITTEMKAHAWFVAYAPAKTPQIAVAVIVEHGEHGSSAASPIARDLIQLYLSPEETEALLQAQSVGQGPAAEASDTLQ